MGITRAVARGAEGYPARLESLSRPPETIFLEGDWSHEGPLVAIVGARDADGDGTDLAHDLAAGLAAVGVAVISGLARGIDAAAHRGALEAGGASGAVLGTPLAGVYPREHRELQVRLAESLGLMTEVRPGAAPTKATFATRNRLLAALSDAVVLVQGRATSGALLTVQAALGLGRPVGAVPWDPREPLGEAPLSLLHSGRASLVRDPADVMALLGLAAPSAPRRFRPRVGSSPKGASTGAPEARLLAALRRRPEPLESTAARAGLTIAEAGAALVALEIQGSAERHPGGAVSRTRGR